MPSIVHKQQKTAKTGEKQQTEANNGKGSRAAAEKKTSQKKANNSRQTPKTTAPHDTWIRTSTNDGCGRMGTHLSPRICSVSPELKMSGFSKACGLGEDHFEEYGVETLNEMKDGYLIGHAAQLMTKPQRQNFKEAAKKLQHPESSMKPRFPVR